MSGGVTGARVGIKPSGQSYVAGGRGGLYYRQNIGNVHAKRVAGSGVVRGHATNKATGDPAPGIGLRLTMSNFPEAERVFVTDPKGRFEVTGLPGSGGFLISGPVEGVGIDFEMGEIEVAVDTALNSNAARALSVVGVAASVVLGLILVLIAALYFGG